jgi:hypothetical protein
MPINPQPKPTPKSRPKGMIDYSVLPFSKFQPVRNARYREYVRRHSCTLFAALECKGPIQCAHLTPPGAETFGKKWSDIGCVPLCRYHHDQIDRRVFISEAQRNEKLVICFARALELREAWWRKETAV